jgi:hypothetical protein
LALTRGTRTLIAHRGGATVELDVTGLPPIRSGYCSIANLSNKASASIAAAPANPKAADLLESRR